MGGKECWYNIVATVAPMWAPGRSGVGAPTAILAHVSVTINGTSRWHRKKEFPTDAPSRSIGDYLAVQQGEALQYVVRELGSGEEG